MGLYLFWFLSTGNICIGQYIQSGTSTAKVRECVADQCNRLLYVREATGKNDGKEVKQILACVGLPEGYPWCAAYVKYVLALCGVQTPINAMAMSATPLEGRIWGKGTLQRAAADPLPGDVFSIYYSSLKRIGHTGFVTNWNGTKSIVATNEGNTNTGGSREGIGVFNKWRQKNQIHCVARWIK
jgi:hypothetical protein